LGQRARLPGETDEAGRGEGLGDQGGVNVEAVVLGDQRPARQRLEGAEEPVHLGSGFGAEPPGQAGPIVAEPPVPQLQRVARAANRSGSTIVASELRHRTGPRSPQPNGGQWGSRKKGRQVGQPGHRQRRDQRLKDQGGTAARRPAHEQLRQARRTGPIETAPVERCEQQIERGERQPGGRQRERKTGAGIAAPPDPSREANGVLEVRRNEPSQRRSQPVRRQRGPQSSEGRGKFERARGNVKGRRDGPPQRRA